MLRMDKRYYAHANIRAGREIVPEVHGTLDACRIGGTVAELLRDRVRLQRLSAELALLMGPDGAARHLIDEIDACFFQPTR